MQVQLSAKSMKSKRDGKEGALNRFHFTNMSPLVQDESLYKSEEENLPFAQEAAFICFAF